MHNVDIKYNIYLYSYIFNSEKRNLLWKECDSGDFFICNEDGSLTTYNSTDDLIKINNIDHNLIHTTEQSEINFDLFWKCIYNLRKNRSPSNNTCTIIINGWNFIEDILKTFNITEYIFMLKSQSLNLIYDKFFHGMNIPPTTPDNNIYYPLFTSDEIHELRNVMKEIWNYLFNTRNILH